MLNIQEKFNDIKSLNYNNNPDPKNRNILPIKDINFKQKKDNLDKIQKRKEQRKLSNHKYYMKNHESLKQKRRQYYKDNKFKEQTYYITSNKKDKVLQRYYDKMNNPLRLNLYRRKLLKNILTIFDNEWNQKVSLLSKFFKTNRNRKKLLIQSIKTLIGNKLMEKKTVGIHYYYRLTNSGIQYTKELIKAEKKRK